MNDNKSYGSIAQSWYKYSVIAMAIVKNEEESSLNLKLIVIKNLLTLSDTYYDS